MFRKFSILVAVVFALLSVSGSRFRATAQTAVPTAAPTAEGPATEAPTYHTTGPNELTVLEWAYYDVPDMWADFGAAHPNVKVNFNFGASDEDIFAKTKAGSGEDIIHFYTPFLKFYVDEGLIQPIDVSKITHWSEIPAQFQNLCTLDGKVYCVPWDWGFTSILYRTDKVTKPVDSWQALFDTDYKGHVSMWDSGYGAMEVGSYIQGYDITKLTRDNFNQLEKMWVAQRDLDKLYWTAEPELVQAMTSGDVWIAYAWNGAYYQLLKANVPVAYATPKEGRNSWVGLYAVSSKTPNKDLAVEFLNDKLGEKSATNLLNEYAYGHVNPKYYANVTDKLLTQALSLNDPTVLQRTNFTAPITFQQFQQAVQMWAEVKAAP